MNENADTVAAGINESRWDVDGTEVRIITPERTEGDAAQLHVLMAMLECSEVEAEHVLRILREDGEFITSVHADIDAL
mgnify:CR=1 FL=1